MKPIKRKVPKGRAGGTVSAVRHAAANPKPKTKRKVPKVAPAPTYTHAKGGKKKTAAKKKPGALKRLAKFVKGDYNKP